MSPIAGPHAPVNRSKEQRRRTLHDTRSVSVSLTPAGHALFQSTLPFAHEANRKYLEGISKSDVLALRRSLVRIYANVRRLTGEAG
jgi:DNA-binding MarR family transcriptional regulator